MVLSATNGKTTTAAMAASVLERSGVRLVHNRAGANLASGVASTLLAAARSVERSTGSSGCSRWTNSGSTGSFRELHPRAVLLSNLFRDQLDRYGELETIADRWAAVVATLDASSQRVLNADDPLIADLGRDGDEVPDNVTFFGVEDLAIALPEMQHASDSKHCRRCGAAYVYDTIYLGHLGRYHCPSCGQRRPTRRSPPTISCSTAPVARASSCARRWGPRRSSSRCRACTTSTTRSGRRRCACRSACHSSRSPMA